MVPVDRLIVDGITLPAGSASDATAPNPAKQPVSFERRTTSMDREPSLGPSFPTDRNQPEAGTNRHARAGARLRCTA